VGAWLEESEVDVRRYTSRFLQGKAYLFGNRGDPRAALVTSANLTQAGLVSNLGLGLGLVVVVVDEAHALRNEGTTWYRAMERLLGGERKQAVLLTATPVNNGLWDLYNLVMLFARHDRAFASVGIPSARELFVRAGAGERDPETLDPETLDPETLDPETLDPDLLFPLADAVSVRRDRLFIEESYPGETFPDGTPVRFPEPRLETRRYDLDESHPGLFEEITDAIGARFSPKTVVRPDYEPADGEVDLLLSTDVLSEGQNLQQAQAVVSYDMPWNLQRVVQRNGRVIRLLSPHDEVFLTTMLPEAGDLEELLRLESTVRAKIRAAGVFGMESEVIEGVELELRSYAERLAGGDIDPSGEEGDVDGELSGAFLGERLRAELQRSAAEGEFERIASLPWGVGSVIRPPAGPRGPRRAGIFFATRTRGMPGADDGHRYWRFVPSDGGDLVVSDLEMLRLIDPAGAEEIDEAASRVELEPAWARACAHIVDEHNLRADPRTVRESIGPAQRFALELLRDPAVPFPRGRRRPPRRSPPSVPRPCAGS